MIWLRWLMQGRPDMVPVVLNPGWLIVVADGGMHMVNWTFYTGRMRIGLDYALTSQKYRELLWEYLANLYPRRVVWIAEDQWQMMQRASTS